MRDNSRTAVTTDTLLERAREVARLAAEQAQAIEQQRRLPDELMQAMKDSELLRVLQPAHWGGYERDLRTFVRVATEIAKGDTSTGWVYCILGIHYFWISYVEPALQEEIWGKDSSVMMADSFAPTGTAQEVSGGYRLNGQWSFLSGLWCSDWIAVGARVAPQPDAPAEWTMMFVPKSDYRLDDRWHVVGLQGSDSNTVVVENAFVPHQRVYWLERAERTGISPGQQLHPNALYQLPFIPTLGVALLPTAIGSARSAITHFQEWTRTRAPVYGPGETPLPGTASAHIALAEATTTVEALEGLMMQNTDELVTEYGQPGRVPSAQERAKYYAWRSYIVRQSARVVNRLFELSGGRSLYLQHPLQRIWRDLHAVSQHIALHYEAGLEAYGRTLVGLPSGSPL